MAQETKLNISVASKILRQMHQCLWNLSSRGRSNISDIRRISIKYKGRTDNNSRIRPNEAVRVAIQLLQYLLDRDKRTAKWKMEEEDEEEKEKEEEEKEQEEGKEEEGEEKKEDETRDSILYSFIVKKNNLT